MCALSTLHRSAEDLAQSERIRAWEQRIVAEIARAAAQLQDAEISARLGLPPSGYSYGYDVRAAQEQALAAMWGVALPAREASSASTPAPALPSMTVERFQELRRLFGVRLWTLPPHLFTREAEPLEVDYATEVANDPTLEESLAAMARAKARREAR
jgi:hypothetical protein